MVAEAPDDLVVVGDGALLAALTRSRGAQMRDIVATIQRHQDEAIRASARGITEITGGPGTGKTVVALHRAAYLLYSDRRRFEAGGILVVGPSSAYTAYIERVLPSLGEESVTLRSLGDVVDGVTASRLDTPEVAAIKGSLRIRRLLARASADAPPEAPRVVPGLRQRQGGAGRRPGPRPDPRPGAAQPPAQPRDQGRPERAGRGRLGQRPRRRPRRVHGPVRRPPRGRRLPRGLVAAGGPPRGAAVAGRPRADPPARRTGAVPAGVRPVRRVDAARARDRHLVGRRRRAGRRPRRPARPGPGRTVRGARVLRDRGVRGRLAVRRGRGAGRRRTPAPSAPGRRGRHRPTRASCCCRAASTARASTPTSSSTRPRTCHPCSGGCSAVAAATRRGPSSAMPPRPRGPMRSRPAAPARRPSAAQERRLFHMDTNYRNAREIFDYAAAVVRAHVPDADIPQAVRETGVDPVDVTVAGDGGRQRPPRPSRRCSTRSRGRSPSSPREVCRGAGRGGRRSATGWRHRPDVDQGPRVRRHRHRRPRRDHGRVTRWGAGPLRRAHPSGAPDDGAPPRLARTAGRRGTCSRATALPWSHRDEAALRRERISSLTRAHSASAAATTLGWVAVADLVLGELVLVVDGPAAVEAADHVEVEVDRRHEVTVPDRHGGDVDVELEVLLGVRRCRTSRSCPGRGGRAGRCR